MKQRYSLRSLTHLSECFLFCTPSTVINKSFESQKELCQLSLKGHFSLSATITLPTCKIAMSVHSYSVLSLWHISVCLRGHSSCAPVLVLPVSVALCSPYPPTLKPHPSHCHNNTCRERKKKNITPQSQTQRLRRIGVQVKTTGSSPSLPRGTMTDSTIYSTQHCSHKARETGSGLLSHSCPPACVCVHAC